MEKNSKRRKSSASCKWNSLRNERGRRQAVGSKVSGWTGSCSRFLHLQMQSKTRFQDKCLQVMLSEKPDWRPLPGLYSRESPPADLAPRRMYSHAFWCLAKKGKKILKVLWSFWQLFIATVCTLEGLALANDLHNQPEAASVRLAEFRNTVNTFHLLGVRSSHAKSFKAPNYLLLICSRKSGRVYNTQCLHNHLSSVSRLRCQTIMWSTWHVSKTDKRDDTLPPEEYKQMTQMACIFIYSN